MPDRCRQSLFRAVLVVAAMWPSATAAQPAPSGPAEPVAAPAVTTEVRTQVGTSYNNAGLQQSLEWSRRRLLRPGTGPMTADAHVSFGSQVAVSPSYARAGLWGQYAPLSLITVRVGVEPAQYFGTFDSLMSFERQDDAFDTDSRKARGGAASGRVLRIYATPTLRFRVGPLVAMASGDVERWASSAEGPWFYEPTRDTALKSTGASVLASRTIVMYEHVTGAGTRLGLGAIHTDQQVNRRHLNRVQRLGAITTIQSEGRWRWLRRPTVNLLVARYLDDPSKDGELYAALTIATTLRRR